MQQGELPAARAAHGVLWPGTGRERACSLRRPCLHIDEEHAVAVVVCARVRHKIDQIPGVQVQGHVDSVPLGLARIVCLKGLRHQHARGVLACCAHASGSACHPLWPHSGMECRAPHAQGVSVTCQGRQAHVRSAQRLGARSWVMKGPCGAQRLATSLQWGHAVLDGTAAAQPHNAPHACICQQPAAGRPHKGAPRLVRRSSRSRPSPQMGHAS